MPTMTDPHGYYALKIKLKNIFQELRSLALDALANRLEKAASWYMTGSSTEFMLECFDALEEVKKGSNKLPNNLNDQIAATLSAIRIGFEKSGHLLR